MLSDNPAYYNENMNPEILTQGTLIDHKILSDDTDQPEMNNHSTFTLHVSLSKKESF